MIKKLNLFTLILFCILCGCAHAPVTPQADRVVEIPKILAQVSEAISAAREVGGSQAPAVTSVELELQVGTTTDLKTQMPILFFTTGPQESKESTHHLSVTFQPQIEKLPKSTGTPTNPKLTEALKGLFSSLAKTGSEYVFQRGSIQIECTFTKEIDLSTTPTVLVPAQASINNSSASIQRLTLNFGPSSVDGAQLNKKSEHQ